MEKYKIKLSVEQIYCIEVPKDSVKSLDEAIEVATEKFNNKDFTINNFLYKKYDAAEMQ